jgi:hypothetical protein
VQDEELVLGSVCYLPELAWGLALDWVPEWGLGSEEGYSQLAQVLALAWVSVWEVCCLLELE